MSLVERNTDRATEHVDRTRLPIRRSVFKGVSNRTLAGSKPDWDLIEHVTPPEGAPNVLLVLIDDAGFGNPSTFGGPVNTPNLTRVADEGVRYNRFHVTALCSPGVTTIRSSSVPSASFLQGFPATPLSAQGLRTVPQGLAAERIQHRSLRQVAPDP